MLFLGRVESQKMYSGTDNAVCKEGIPSVGMPSFFESIAETFLN